MYISTGDFQLSGLLARDYPDWVMTVQLECFVISVRFIRLFE